MYSFRKLCFMPNVAFLILTETGMPDDNVVVACSTALVICWIRLYVCEFKMAIALINKEVMSLSLTERGLNLLDISSFNLLSKLIGSKCFLRIQIACRILSRIFCLKKVGSLNFLFNVLQFLQFNFNF